MHAIHDFPLTIIIWIQFLSRAVIERISRIAHRTTLRYRA